MSEPVLNRREEVWVRVWAAVSGSSGCTSTKTATAWAEKALEEFDKRFPEPQRVVVVETQGPRGRQVDLG